MTFPYGRLCAALLLTSCPLMSHAAPQNAPAGADGAKPAFITAQKASTPTTVKPAAMAAAKTPRPFTPRSYITDWPTGKKLIALTYDDGPDPRITPKLIELLQQKKVPATFYVLGQRVNEYPEITRRLHDLGFEVVNHTYTHKLLTKLPEAQVKSELQRTNDLITSITGVPVTHMRPPYGGRNAKVDEIIRDMGMKIVLWDIDTEDWRKRSAAQMTNQILKNASDGSIVLFHDRYQASLDSTAAVIDDLRARGFTFVTVGELLSHKHRDAISPLSAEATTTIPSPPPSE